MGFIDYDRLIEKLLNILIEKQPELLGAGGFIISVMAIGTIVLTIAIIYLSISTPVELTKKIYKDIKK